MFCRLLAPEVVSHSVTISAREKSKHWQEGLSLLVDMILRLLTPDDVSYSAAISALEKGKQWQEALFLL